MEASPQCPVIFASRILGGRWSAKIVHLLLHNEKLRYSELRRGCPPISDRILSLELKDLQRWGLVSRQEYGTIPPRTEYRLTELGQTLRPLLEAMVTWGRHVQAQVGPSDDGHALSENTGAVQ